MEEGQARAKEPYVAQATVKIKRGKPNPKDVYVVHGAVVRFTNEDPQDYVVRLFAQGGSIAPDVDLYLPSFDSRTLIAGLDLPPEVNRDCVYEVILTLPTSIGEDADVDSTPPTSRPVARDTKAGSGGGSGTVHVGGN
jgi:hypothetical protein